MHLPVSAACALYDAPEDGCVLHPKHVEQNKKCNEITLNNLHQAGPNKPNYNFVLYVCETWLLPLREERRLRVFENRVLRRVFGPKRDEVTGE